MGLRKTAKYAKISLKRRVKLIQLTSKPNMSISKAAKVLGLKPSTAKLIVKRYREDGTFFESKTSREKRLITNEDQRENQNPQRIAEIRHQNAIDQLIEGQNVQDFSHEAAGVLIAPTLMWSAEYQCYYWALTYNCSGALQ